MKLPPRAHTSPGSPTGSSVPSRSRIDSTTPVTAAPADRNSSPPTR